MPSVANVYQTNRAVSASPLSRLLTVYDYTLRACENQRVEDLTRGLRVLMEGLDFGYPVANQLASLYQWCGELGRQQRFREAARLLQELRDAWAEAATDQAALAAATKHSRAMESITAIV
jgi:flagellin-specific chaperone FliS